MDTGIIMIGFALVLLSFGMLVSPSGAATCDRSCTVGCGSTFSSADATATPYSPLEGKTRSGCRALFNGPADHGSTP